MSKQPPKLSFSHKSAEAKAERDRLDESVVRLLSSKRFKDGLVKAQIVHELTSDAAAVKASLDRLKALGLLTSEGNTMRTTYRATKDAEKMLRDLRKPKTPKRAARPPSEGK